MEMHERLRQAIAQAAAEGQRAEETHNAFGTYIYAGKKQELEEILAQWESGIGTDAFLEKLAARRQRLRELQEQEEQHPTFEWASDHYWACIYTGAEYGCEQAIRILKESLAE